MDHHAALERRLAAAIRAAVGPRWALTRAWSEPQTLCVALTVPDGEATAPLILEVRAPDARARAYRVVRALAFSYRGRSLPQGAARGLDSAIAALAEALAEAGWSPTAPASGLSSSEPAFPTPRQAAHLEEQVALSSETIAAFRRDGHVLVRRAVDPDVIIAARDSLRSALERAVPKDLPPPKERPDAYSRSFTQIADLGLSDPMVRAFTHARRFARMAADLMGVDGVQLFCEDWLIKEPGADITPWHQDEAVYPFEASETITCWIPLDTVKQGEGLLRFARGSHRIGLAAVENIDDTSEAAFASIIAEHGFEIDLMSPVFIGDVSFHHGRTIHGALPNGGERPRIVLALHCFAAGARIKAPSTPTMSTILRHAAPSAKPGDPAVSPRWPALSIDAPASVTPVGSGRRWHLRGTVLPSGTVPTDLWIADGRVWTRPVEGAEELPLAGGFVTTGLVDGHSHISYPHTPEEPVDTVEWMNTRRAEHAATGVLVLRDMGAVTDAICGLVDVPGLPRVHAAGTMILRYDTWPFTRTEPDALVEAFCARIASGARWVKVFADWSRDFRGRVNTGFSGKNDVTYALDALARAVAAVHELGGRVAAHCYTRAGAEVAIGAGVDSLEHGWGVDERLVETMAKRGIAWVPLVGIATSEWRIARRDAEPDRMRWLEASIEALRHTLPLAQAAGVRIIAGTDRFPTVTVADEVRQLVELGLAPEAAVAAGAWSARAWLGEPGIEDGAPADLAVYASDPREDPSVLLRPALIVSGGVQVAPSWAGLRPRFVSWRERATDD